MFKFIIIVISLFIILTYFNKNNQAQSNDKVPKIIWSYWDTEEIPEIVKLSIKSWKKTSPNYKINFTNQKNIEELVSLPKYWKTLPPYRQADIIRLHLVEKYGGVWIDSSTILLESLDNFISKDNLTFFITPQSNLKNPVLENWFFSAPPNNKVIKMWTEEVLKALENQKEYVNKSSDYNKKSIGNLIKINYLICHLALKNIYEKNKSLFNKAKIYVSNDTAWYYLNNTPNMKYLFKRKFDKKRLMIKLTGYHRKKVDLKYFDKSLVE